MKTFNLSLIVLALALFYTSSLQAQNLSVEGNVGIGTNEPTARLNIDNGAANTGVNGGFLLLGSTSVGEKNLGLDDDGIQARIDGGISSLFIQEFGGNTILNQSSGRVGIGTSSPAGLLSINSSSENNVEVLSFQEAGSTDASFFFESDFVGSGETGNSLSFKSFWVGDVLTFRGDGNIGIDTNNPQAKLQILGGSDVNSTDGGYLINGSLTGTNLGIDNNEIQARNNGAASILYVNPEGGDISMVRDDGNVGIGTASPVEKLHVEGDTRIRGKLDLNVGDRSVVIGAATSSAIFSESVLVGYAAGASLVDDGAGFVDATFIGKDAGRQCTTGQQNTAVGLNTGEAITTEQFGTYVGAFSGASNASNFATFVGYNVNSIANFDNSTALGSNILVSGSNKVVLGNIAQSEVQSYVNFSSVSDGRFKKNVKENVRGLDFIMDLRPVTYQLDTRGLDNFLRKGMKTDEQIDLSSYNQALREKSNITYTGFIAQEVEQAATETGFDFSGIVKPQNEQDHYGLRYAEFVVPLVKGMQEQQEEIEELKNTNDEVRNTNSELRNEVNELKERLTKIEALLKQSAINNSTTDHRLSTTNSVLTDAKLEQNQPNPFNGSTVVRYFIPEGIKKAVLRITSIEGKVVKEVVIQARGEGQTTFDATTLSSGNYQYSLFLDGQLLDTKQMVLTKN